MSSNASTTTTNDIDKTGVSHNKEDMTEFMLKGLINRAGSKGEVYYGPKLPRERTSATKDARDMKLSMY